MLTCRHLLVLSKRASSFVYAARVKLKVRRSGEWSRGGGTQLRNILLFPVDSAMLFTATSLSDHHPIFGGRVACRIRRMLVVVRAVVDR